MANIFNISERYYNLLNKLEDEIMEFDTPTDETIAELNATDEELKDKLEAFYYVIKMKEAEQVTLKDEIERLLDVIRVKQNLIDRLKKITITVLEQFGETTPSGGKKIDTGKLKIWNVYHKPLVLPEDYYNPDYGTFKLTATLNADDVEKIKEFLNVDKDNFKFTPSKIDIKNAIEEGVEFPENVYIDKTASYVRFK